MKIKNIFLIGLLGSMIFACESIEDLIETNPRQSLTPDIALENVNGFQGVLFSAYSRIHNFGYYGQQMMLGPEALADNLIIANNTGRYIGQVVNAVGSHINIWNDTQSSSTFNAYRVINEVNIVLTNVDDLELILEADINLRERIKGESHFLRALAYFDLLRIYSYEPGREVNGWDAGVILRETATEVVSDAAFRPRSTNLEGYELVERDLLDAIALLPEEADASSTPYRASKASARALLAKVYLYWGRYADAATQADLALASTSAIIVPAADYVSSFSAIPHPESIFESEVRAVDYSSVDGINNSMNSITSDVTAQNQFAVAASPELMASLDARAGDVRRDLFVGPDDQGRFSCIKWPGEKGDFLENIHVIRTSDVLLIAAEGKARSGNTAGAQDDVQLLWDNRGIVGTVNQTGQALLDLILDERRKELALEGNRFFDLKRLGLPITKTATSGVNNIPASDFRILGPIPFAQEQLNPLLEQNPGY
jgi:hypothetical protein